MSNPNGRTNSNSMMEVQSSSNDAAAAELSAVVEELLNGITTKFSTVSSDLLAKMDDMSRRLDNLEATIQANATTAKKE